jgi:hypothetical protein
MFPPKRTSDPHTLVTGLWSSLNSVGDQFDDQCILEPAKDGYLVFLKLKDSLTSDSITAIRVYMKKYAEAAGWAIPGVVFAKRYIRFRLTRASSRAK